MKRNKLLALIAACVTVLSFSGCTSCGNSGDNHMTIDQLEKLTKLLSPEEQRQFYKNRILEDDILETELKGLYRDKFGESMSGHFVSDPIKYESALLMTNNYLYGISRDTSIIASIEKSVYFNWPKIKLMYDSIINYCEINSKQCNDKYVDETMFGLRIYFGKREGNYFGDDTSRLTLILRATYEGQDIPHFDKEGSLMSGEQLPRPHVAHNIGDICPPTCDPNSPESDFKGGAYAKGISKIY